MKYFILPLLLLTACQTTQHVPQRAGRLTPVDFSKRVAKESMSESYKQATRPGSLPSAMGRNYYQRDMRFK